MRVPEEAVPVSCRFANLGKFILHYLVAIRTAREALHPYKGATKASGRAEKALPSPAQRGCPHPALLTASCRRKPVEMGDAWTHGACGWTWEKHLVQQDTAGEAAARDTTRTGRAGETVADQEVRSVSPCSGVPASPGSPIPPGRAAGGGRVTNGAAWRGHLIVKYFTAPGVKQFVVCVIFVLVLIGTGEEPGRIILNIIGCPDIDLHSLGFLSYPARLFFIVTAK